MTTAPRPIEPAPEGAPAHAPRRARPPASAKTKFAGVAVVCGKCAKRQGLRAKDLRALLKEAGRDLGPVPAGTKGKRRKLCIVESGCLGPCPKRLVAVATGGSLAAGRVLLLDPRAGVKAARAALLPEFGPNTELAPRPTDAGSGDDPSPPLRRPD